jgi:DNA polymerase-4
MVAKIASEEAKPDGLLEVPADRVRAFLDPLPVGRLWGVGPVAEGRLHGAGLATVGELARAAPERLAALLGAALGAQLAVLARGDDERPVEPDRAPVSYSEENTFEGDVDDRERLAAVLLDHAESVARRLRHDGLRARTVVVKVKLAARRPAGGGAGRASGARAYPVLTRRATLDAATDDGMLLAREARCLLARLPDVPVRLVGLAATGLEASPQLGLFERPERRRSERLNRALDELAARFGTRVVVRAGQEAAARAGLSLQAKRGAPDRADDGSGQSS